MVKKALFTILFLSLFAPFVHADITLDATSSGATGAGSPITWTHTTAGNNRLLVFSCLTLDATSGITSITYNSVASSFVGSTTESGTNHKIYMYYLLNPTLGSNTVSVTWSHSGSAIYCSSVSYDGAAQSGALDTSVTSSNSSATTFTQNITTLTNNDWTISTWRNGSAGGTTGGTGTTIRELTAGTSNSTGIADSNANITPAGATSLNEVISPASTWGGVIAAFKAAITTASSTDSNNFIQFN